MTPGVATPVFFDSRSEVLGDEASSPEIKEVHSKLSSSSEHKAHRMESNSKETER